MTILIDTSVWVGHFRKRNDELVRLIQMDAVSTHSMVLLELACGTPPSPRQQTLRDIALLHKVKEATTAEVMWLIENEKLYGMGCGMVDISLLASVLISPGVRIWTFDKSLTDLATRFGCVYEPLAH